jgi:hypothetical protein
MTDRVISKIWEQNLKSDKTCPQTSRNNTDEVPVSLASDVSDFLGTYAVTIQRTP